MELFFSCLSGRVFPAHDREDLRPVLIKFGRPDSADEGELAQRGGFHRGDGGEGGIVQHGEGRFVHLFGDPGASLA